MQLGIVNISPQQFNFDIDTCVNIKESSYDDQDEYFTRTVHLNQEDIISCKVAKKPFDTAKS